MLMIINVVMKVMRSSAQSGGVLRAARCVHFTDKRPELYGVGPDLRGCRLSGVNVQPHQGMFSPEGSMIFFPGI